MLKNTLLCAVALASLPSLAHADNWTQRDQAGTGLGWYASYVGDMRDNGFRASSASTAHDPADCRAIVQKYKSDIGGDEKIQSEYFKIFDGAKEVPDSGYPTKYAISWKQAASICDDYETVRTYLATAAPLAKAYDDVVNDGIRQEDVEALDWYLIATDKDGTYLSASTSAAACTKAVDDVIAAGVPHDFDIQYADGTHMTPDALKMFCEKSDAGGEAFREKAKAWAKKKYDEASAPLKKAGIKGDRLELFVYRDALNGGFYAAGCTTEVTSPKALKKAKKLFMWLEGSDGTITVRTYKFKGDKYTQTEKEYSFPETAYRGCK